MSANLLLDSLRNLWEGFITRLPTILTGLLVLLIFYLVARGVSFLARKSMRKARASEHAALLVARLSFIGVMIAAVLVSLGVMGINAGALVASLGLVSVGIGFALKDVIENFLAGIILIIQRPFMVGDVICIGDVEGSVEDIRTRDTIIRLYDGRQAFVPNSKIFSMEVINNNRKRRLEFEVGIPYSIDASSALEPATASMAGVEGVLEKPSPLVVVEGLGNSSVLLKVYFWVDPQKANLLEVKSAAIAAVKQGLEEAGIEIPFPILTIKPQT